MQTKTFLIGLVLFSFISNEAWSQASGNFQQNYMPEANIQYRAVPKTAKLLGDRDLEITVNALLNEKASAYLAVFNITQLGKTAEEADRLLNERLNGFKADVLALGIPADDVYTDMVNFVPKFETESSKKIFSRKTYTETPKGFEIQKNLHVLYRKPDLLDRMVTLATKQEIYDLVKVDYLAEKPEEAYHRLREETFRYLERIQKIYLDNGIRLDSATRITAENAWVAYPGNRYQSYKIYRSQSFDTAPNHKGVYFQEADKPTVRFYHAIPGNDYDLIINPIMVEPGVQYSYNLVVKYKLPEDKPKTNKEMYLLTPAGDLKLIPSGN